MKASISEVSLLQKYKYLPSQLKQEVVDFMEFIMQKHTETDKINSSQKQGKRKLGYFPKGTFEMSNDFNEPLGNIKQLHCD